MHVLLLLQHGIVPRLLCLRTWALPLGNRPSIQVLLLDLLVDLLWQLLLLLKLCLCSQAQSHQSISSNHCVVCPDCTCSSSGG